MGCIANLESNSSQSHLNFDNSWYTLTSILTIGELLPSSIAKIEVRLGEVLKILLKPFQSAYEHRRQEGRPRYPHICVSERKKYVKNSDLIAYRKKIARIPIAEFKLRSLFYPTPVTPRRRGRRTYERHARSAFSKGC